MASPDDNRPGCSTRWTTFGIRDVHGYTYTEKTELQDLAIRGAPFTEQETAGPSALLRG